MKLNSDQQSGKEKIIDFLDGPNKFFLLEGVAGTGKTTLITNIFEDHKYVKLQIAFSATTNKAVSVLKSLSTMNRETVHFITIQKLLKIRRNVNEDGKELYTFMEDLTSANDFRKRSIRTFNIIIIDEVSMINTDLLNNIEAISSKIKAKFILLGDRNQLPPINEKISRVFSKNYKNNYHTLTIIERFKNDIVKYSNSVISNNKLKKSELNKAEIEFTKDYNKWILKYLENIDNSIILSYTNYNRSKINRDIRKKLFPRETRRFSKNDRIIFNSFYKTEHTSYHSSQINTIFDIREATHTFVPLPMEYLINLKIPLKKLLVKTKPKEGDNLCPICLDNDIDEMEQTFCGHVFCSSCIKTWLKQNNCCPLCRCNISKDNIEIKNFPEVSTKIMELKEILSNVTIKIWNIEVLEGSGEDNIIVISDESLEEFKKLKETIEAKLLDIKQIISKKSDKFNNLLLIRLWEFYYENYIDSIADIDYGYCITVHKSQGSTYSNIFIDIQDIIKNNKNDVNECVYTAITRASNSLSILK